MTLCQLANLLHKLQKTTMHCKRNFDEADATRLKRLGEERRAHRQALRDAGRVRKE